MIFFYIKYIVTLSILLFGIIASFRKYFNYSIVRSEDFYLLTASIFVFLNFALQFSVLIMGVYCSGAILFSHLMKTFGFWGFLSFLVTQVHFKNSSMFRIYKLIIFLVFVIVTALASSLTAQYSTFYYVARAETLAHRVTLISNVYSDIMLEILCLISSISLLLPVKKLTYLNRKSLYISIYGSITAYFISVLNLIVFNGLNTYGFYSSQIIGSIASIFMIHTIYSYFKLEKDIYKERKKRLIRLYDNYRPGD